MGKKFILIEIVEQTPNPIIGIIFFCVALLFVLKACESPDKTSTAPAQKQTVPVSAPAQAERLDANQRAIQVQREEEAQRRAIDQNFVGRWRNTNRHIGSGWVSEILITRRDSDLELQYWIQYCRDSNEGCIEIPESDPDNWPEIFTLVSQDSLRLTYRSEIPGLTNNISLEYLTPSKLKFTSILTWPNSEDKKYVGILERRE
jgi:hypothetical protein